MTRARQALFTLLICLVYVIPFPYLQGINNPNENTRTYLVMALVDDHSWSLDRVVARYGWTNDMASVPDATAANGSHLAAVKGPATAYLGVPVYVAQRAVMSLLGKGPPSPTSPATERAAWLRTTTLTLELFCSHLPCLAFLLWMERRLRAWSKDDVLRLSAVLSVAIGSNFLAYSFVFVSHALIGATAFVAVDWLLRCRAHPTHERVSWHAWMAGLAAGFITLLEYPALFVSACLGVYALWVLRGWKPRLMFALGAALNAALLMLFQWGSFGNPLTPGHRMMQTQEFKALSEKGFFTLGLPDPHAAFALLFDSTFGLLSTSPFLMLSIVGVAAALFLRRSDGAWVQRRSIALLASICVALIVMAVSASVIWRGGWTIGPRYLGLAPPLLATVALFGLESWATSSTRRWIARGVAGALLVASFVKIGAIAFVVVTLPEAIEKPVAQMFVPLVKTGFVPHHALEVIGIDSTWPWWLALLAACVLALLPMMPAAREKLTSWAARCVLATALAFVLIRSAVSMPSDKVDAAGNEARTLFVNVWEPAGRDEIARARERAKSDPCAWRDVATFERVLGRVQEVARAERMARSCVR